MAGPRVLLASVLFLTVAASAAARTWNVSADGSGDAPTLQAAVDSSSAGDLILAAAGFYADTLNFRGKAVTVRGAGTASTVIDGMGRSSVVRFESGEGRGSVLEEFTITNGVGYSLQIPGSRLGGGVYIHNAEPTIRGNVIAGNSAIRPLSEGAAGEGGGVYCDGQDGNIHAPLIQGNAIRDNVAGAAGGGISVVGSMRPEIVNNLIRNNEVENGDGGGIRLLVSVAGTIIDRNRIEANVVSCRGGGIAVPPPANGLPLMLSPEISWNLIVRNRALGIGETGNSVSGGGLWLGESGAVVVRNTISGNFGYGVDTTWGGGIAVSGPGSPLIERNIIAFSGAGGGLACEASSTPVVRDNLSWLHAGGSGSGSCRFWMNGSGNTAGDPRFCARETGDYRLAVGSPAFAHPAGPVGAIDTPGCEGTAVVSSTWGLLKARYGGR